MAPYVPGPYVGNQNYVGGDIGTDFVAVRGLEGQLVKKFEVWYDDTSITGMRVTFTNSDRSQVFGLTASKVAELNLEPLERVTELNLWGNGAGEYTGRVRIVTSKQQRFEYGKTMSDAGYASDVGSGLFAGIAGRCDSRIRISSLFFLSDVRSVNLHDVSYLNAPSGGINPVMLSQGTFDNQTTANTGWTFTNTVTRTNSHSFTNSKSMQLGVSVAVGATLFDLVKTSTTFSWQQTTQQSTTDETSNAISLSWNLSGNLTPSESVLCTSMCQQGNFSIDYSGKVTVVMEDGYTFTYDVTGTYKNVVYGFATAEAQHSLPGSGTQLLRVHHEGKK